MLRFLVLLSVSGYAWSGAHYPKGDLTFRCNEANDEVDQVVANSNLEIQSHGENNMLVDYYGFDANVGLHAFGWRLPISVGLSVSQGNLTGIGTLKRSSVDAVECSNPITRTLEGVFEYGPDLSFKYDEANATFWFMEVQGKFTFKPKPRYRIAMLNGSFDCRYEAISSENPGPSEYIFETENTWKGWLISKMLVMGLNQKDETSLGMQMDLWCQGDTASYLTKAWCAYINQDN